jgi:hypothetical protein
MVHLSSFCRGNQLAPVPASAQWLSSGFFSGALCACTCFLAATIAWFSLLCCTAALLAGGANPNQPNKDVTSALHATAQRGPLRLLQLLLEAKADVQAADAQGGTPLHLAARSGNAQKVQCLLAAGAYHGAVNSQGNTPLHLVRIPVVMQLMHACCAVDLGILRLNWRGGIICCKLQSHHMLASDVNISTHAPRVHQ